MALPSIPQNSKIEDIKQIDKTQLKDIKSLLSRRKEALKKELNE